MSGITIETIQRVFLDDEGVYLEVGPGGDGFGVEVRTVDQDSSDWFGEVRLFMSKEFCVELGKVLIKAGEGK